MRVKLTTNQAKWLCNLYTRTSPFCRSKSAWDWGGVRAYVQAVRPVSALIKHGLVEERGNELHVTPDGVAWLDEEGKESGARTQ